MADRISLRLRRNDMNVFRTLDEPGQRPIVHVARKYPAALYPSCERPSVTTNGTGWRDVIDVVRTVVITLAVCVRRFICEEEDCPQRSFDERFEGIGRGGASSRALGFFPDLSRGRARAVARDLGVPEYYLRVAVGAQRRRAHERLRGRLAPHFALARARDALEADDSRMGERQRLALFDAVNLDRTLGVAYELKEALRTAMAIGRSGDVETSPPPSSSSTPCASARASRRS